VNTREGGADGKSLVQENYKMTEETEIQGKRVRRIGGLSQTKESATQRKKRKGLGLLAKKILCRH